MNSSSLVALGMASLLLTPMTLASIGTPAPVPRSGRALPPSGDSDESESSGLDEMELDVIPTNLVQFASAK